MDGDRLPPAISPFPGPGGRVASGVTPLMKLILACWLGSLCSLFAIPANTTLTLVNDPNFNKIRVTVSPQASGINLPDTDTTTLTGTLPAILDIDPITGKTRELTLNNGRASGTNMNFARSSIFVPVYNINVNNISAAINTIAPPGIVTPATGQFAANQHRFDIDQGTITGTALGDPVNQSFTPANPASGTGTGTGTVILTPAGDSGIFRVFTVTMTLPVAIDDTFVSGTTSVALTATGTVKATGTVQVPRTQYLAWTVAERIPGAPFEGDSNGDGVANGLVWALGLTNSADPRPYLPRPHPLVPGGFLISLPDGGTAAPILIQSSPHLGSWSPASGVLAPANPLPAASSGNIAIQPNGSPTRFIRLRVTES